MVIEHYCAEVLMVFCHHIPVGGAGIERKYVPKHDLLPDGREDYMTVLSLHDCAEHGVGCTIVRCEQGNEIAWESHVSDPGEIPNWRVEYALNESYPHHDYRGGKGGTSIVNAMVVP